jgi:hypothetical protein
VIFIVRVEVPGCTQGRDRGTGCAGAPPVRAGERGFQGIGGTLDDER